MTIAAQSARRVTENTKPPLHAGRREVSLRNKGIAAFVVLVLYVVAIGVILAQQRATLRASVEEQRTVYAREEVLARVNSALAYAIFNVHEAYSNPDSRVTADSLVLDLEAVQAGLLGLGEPYPAIHPSVPALEHGIAMLRSEWGRGSLAELRETLHVLAANLNIVTNDVRERQSALSENFRIIYDSMTLTALVSALIGTIVFGSVVMLFFSRLVWDIRKLQARAMEVVTGYRGKPIAVTRHDELGALMDAVNVMQSELREREQQLEIARQQRFHQEKMAAVGSLAAAIAHEVSNPMAAITGVAEAMHETQRSSQCMRGGCRPELILEQTRRISQITRQLAEMTAPYSPEPQLLDLNALVRSTCSFVGYDRRFSNVDLRLEQDPNVPAIDAIADHLTQVLMNLLINAADSTAEVVGRKPTITVTTAVNGPEIEVTVADNGCGMDADTLARAFEEGFTTKPLGRGSGLGLFMCRALVEAEGGRIALESSPGAGTRASIGLRRPTAQG